MIFTATDHQHMQRALSLAKEALYITSPNPRVGCVIVGPTGEIWGEGYTQMAGGDHAEVMALKDAKATGYDVKESTVYVHRRALLRDRESKDRGDLVPVAKERHRFRQALHDGEREIPQRSDRLSR